MHDLAFPFLKKMSQVLWVRFGSFRPTQVPTQDCRKVDSFIQRIQSEMKRNLGNFDPINLNLALSPDGEALASHLELKDLVSMPNFKNDGLNPLYIRIDLDLSPFHPGNGAYWGRGINETFLHCYDQSSSAETERTAEFKQSLKDYY
jgi:hypothetical protein